MNKDFGEQFEVAKSLFWLVNLLLMVSNISFHVASIAKFYQIHASSGVKFSAEVLSRLLDLCSEQTPNSVLPSSLHVPTLAEDILASVLEFHGHATIGNYAALMRTLAHFEMHTR